MSISSCSAVRPGAQQACINDSNPDANNDPVTDINIVSMSTGAAAPFPDGAPSPGQHLKNVFYRQGLGDMEIVALSGAHTLGRVNPNRSGMGKASTIYTKDGPGVPGAEAEMDLNRGRVKGGRGC